MKNHEIEKINQKVKKQIKLCSKTIGIKGFKNHIVLIRTKIVFKTLNFRNI
nr:MAG TPA: hypothetical protein [Caudoviricetes sp.]